MDFRGIKEFIKDTAGYIFVIILVIFVVNYVVTIQQNVGHSMDPTLMDGDAFLLNKITYKISDVKRGDIVTINIPDAKKSRWISSFPNFKEEILILGFVRLSSRV